MEKIREFFGYRPVRYVFAAVFIYSSMLVLDAIQRSLAPTSSSNKYTTLLEGYKAIDDRKEWLEAKNNDLTNYISELEMKLRVRTIHDSTLMKFDIETLEKSAGIFTNEKYGTYLAVQFRAAANLKNLKESREDSLNRVHK